MPFVDALTICIILPTWKLSLLQESMCDMFVIKISLVTTYKIDQDQDQDQMP